MDVLHAHFQEVHMKQQSSTVKGLLTLAKQKLSLVTNSVPNLATGMLSNSSTSTSTTGGIIIGTYAQYFSDNYSQQTGCYRSHTEKFRKFRKDKLEKIQIDMTKLLLRLEQLTNLEHLPSSTTTKNSNKERKKYEQDIVEWLDATQVKLCPSCAKQFGLSRRKHHCRLDGFIICNQCSVFLPFSTARYLIEPTSSKQESATTNNTNNSINNVAFHRSNSHTSLTSILSTVAGATDETISSGGLENETNYLRICLSCRDVLQKRYKQIRHKSNEKDEIYAQYERISDSIKELQSIHPSYSTIIESLLNGETTYQAQDAQRLYRRLSGCFEVIDSTSKLILNLSDSCPGIDDNDKHSLLRHQTICRNIRSYSIQLLQNYAISTLRVPTDDDIQRARQERTKQLDEQNDLERQAKTELFNRVNIHTTTPSPAQHTPRVATPSVAGWKPTIDRSVMNDTQELEPLVQQIYQVTQFMRQAQIAGRDDEVKLLELNLKELEQAMKQISS